MSVTSGLKAVFEAIKNPKTLVGAGMAALALGVSGCSNLNFSLPGGGPYGNLGPGYGSGGVRTSGGGNVSATVSTGQNGLRICPGIWTYGGGGNFCIDTTSIFGSDAQQPQIKPGAGPAFPTPQTPFSSPLMRAPVSPFSGGTDLLAGGRIPFRPDSIALGT